MSTPPLLDRQIPIDFRRRDFLLMLLAGTGGALLGVGCDKRKLVDPDRFVVPQIMLEDLPPTQTPLDKALRHYFQGAELADVQKIGRSYLKHRPLEEATRDVSLAVDLIKAAKDAPQALVLWQQAITAEFTQNQLVSVYGWQLSPTEVRLCSLAKVLL